jgi:hypothetical protein
MPITTQKDMPITVPVKVIKCLLVPNFVIFSNWNNNGAGGLTSKMEDRKIISMCNLFAWQEWFIYSNKSDAIPTSPSSL